jgi:uncharacterized membrane protein YidH (DUF202 family)
MNTKTIGTVLIIVGIILIYWGYNNYNPSGIDLTRTFSDSTPIETWKLVAAGLVSIFIGRKIQ